MIKYKLPVGLFAVFLIWLFFVAWVYSAAWSGSWHFDDAPNLAALGDIFGQGKISTSAASQFVLSGDAGPFGRPVSLLSFLIDGSAWLHGPRAMLYTNTFLHLLNGLLVFWLFIVLGRTQRQTENAISWTALFASMIWLAMPLLASSSLLVVQRMTILASTFMLLGMIGYLKARGSLAERPLSSMLLMGASLGAATVLGVLSKEQAILLPSLVLLIEFLLLPRVTLPQQQRLWLAFRFVALVLPTVLILLYLFNTAIRSGGVYGGREFNLAERLWTESIILWDYLIHAFLPRSLAFGPFHDDYPIYQASLKSILASVSWGVAFLAAFLLRHKTKLFLFALLWYWTAHLIESTVIGLELYFEHRNYLAVIGPIYALVIGVYQLTSKKPYFKWVNAAISLYSVLLLGVLFQVTSLFGQPALAAELWYIEHPQSSRATQYLAGELTSQNNIAAALRVLDKASNEHQNSAALRLQGLQLACVLNADETDLADRYEKSIKELPLAPKRFSVTTTLNILERLYRSDSCHGFFTVPKLVDLAKASLSNPVVAGPAQERTNLHIYIALLYLHERNLPNTMHHIIEALEATPTVPILGLAVSVLHSAGLYAEALELIDEHPPRLPKNPVLRAEVQHELDKLVALAQAKPDE